MMTVVVGVGNRYRSDDAAGLEVARLVADASLSGVEAIEHDGEPAGLVETLTGRTVAYVVDALSGEGQAGRVHRFDATDRPVPERPLRHSSHSLGLGEAVELARALGRMPSRLVVLGIEGSRFTAGVGLTPEVSAAVHRVVREILDDLGDEEQAEVSSCA
jgi:hydrogenase maturation protease